MVTQFDIVILSGDLCPRGRGLIGPAGLTHPVALPWARVARMDLVAKDTDVRKGPAMLAAVGAGYAASALLGPLGVATAAAVAGIAAGTARRDVVEIVADDGRRAILRGPRGFMAAAREWREIAALHAGDPPRLK